MAKQLWFTDDPATAHRGNNDAKLNSVASWWQPFALSEVRGNHASGIVKSVACVAGPTNGVEITLSGGTGTPLEWLSEPLSNDFTITGTITANLWSYETTMNDNAAINFVVEKIDGASDAITQIVKSTRITELSTTDAAVNFTATPTSTACKRGDRLRVRVFADDAGTMAATGGSANFDFDRSSLAAQGDSWIQFTENLTFELPGERGVLDQPTRLFFEEIGIVTREKLAQSFVSEGTQINEISVWLSKYTPATGNLILEIQTDNAGNPSGTVVGTIATVTATSLTTSSVLKTYSSLGINVTNGATYWLVIRTSVLYNGTSGGFGIEASGGVVVGWSTYKTAVGSTWTSTTNSKALATRIAFTGGVTTYYLTDTAETIDPSPGSILPKKALLGRGSSSVTLSKGTLTGPTAPIQFAGPPGGDGPVIDWYTPPLEAFTLGGKSKFNIRALESNVAANASLRAQIAVVNGDGTGAVVWGIANIQSDAAGGELTTTDAAYFAWVAGDDVAVTAGKRLRFRIYVDDVASGPLVTGHTVTVTYNGVSAAAVGDTYVILPVAVTEEATGPQTRYGVVSRPFTFGKAVAGDFVPTYQTVIDNFDRADGLLNVGAGDAIWNQTKYDGSGASSLRTISNRLGSAVATYQSVYTKSEFEPDCDILLDCIAPPVTPNFEFSIWFLMTDPGTGTFDGYAAIFANGTWILRRYLNGVNQGNITSGAGSLLAGDTIWIRKHSSSIKVYRRPSGGVWTQLLSATDANHNVRGVITVEISDASQRYDNLRGGPVYVPGPQTYYGVVSRATTFGKAIAATKQTFGVVARPITFTKAVAGIRVAPTYFGVVALPITFSKAVAGVRTQKGQVVHGWTFSKAVQGVRKTFGVVAHPITFSVATAGIRQPITYTGVVARPIAFSKDVAGQRKTFGVVAIPTAFTKDVRGFRKTFSQVAAPFTFSKDTQAVRKTFGVVATPITFTKAVSGIGTTGAQTYYGVVALPVSFGKSVQGVRKTFSATAASFVFSKAVQGQRTAISQIVAPFVFSKAVQGRRQTFSTVAAPFVFGEITQARRLTFGVVARPTIFAAVTQSRKLYGSVVVPIIFTKNVIGVRKTYGIVVLPITFVKDVKGIGFTGAQTYFGSSVVSLTFGKAVQGRKQTFGTVARPIVFSKAVAGQKKTFSQIVVPFTFSKAIQGQKKTFGVVARPITVTFTTAGDRASQTKLGVVALSLSFGKAVSGQRKTFSAVARPISFAVTTQSKRKTFATFVLPIVFFKEVQGRRGASSTISMPIIWQAVVRGTSVIYEPPPTNTLLGATFATAELLGAGSVDGAPKLLGADEDFIELLAAGNGKAELGSAEEDMPVLGGVS